MCTLDNIFIELDRHICFRYLVPSDLTVGQFVYVIRKRIKLSPERAIFIFIDNKLPPSGEILVGSVTLICAWILSRDLNLTHVLDTFSAASLMSAIYEEMKDKDGFLYIKYSGENTFGGLLEDYLQEEEAVWKIWSCIREQYSHHLSELYNKSLSQILKSLSRFYASSVI